MAVRPGASPTCRGAVASCKALLAGLLRHIDADEERALVEEAVAAAARSARAASGSQQTGMTAVRQRAVHSDWESFVQALAEGINVGVHWASSTAVEVGGGGDALHGP